MQVYSAEFHRDSVLSEYGIRVHEDMEKVMGRVLPPPAIQYKEQEVWVFYMVLYKY